LISSCGVVSYAAAGGYSEQCVPAALDDWRTGSGSWTREFQPEIPSPGRPDRARPRRREDLIRDFIVAASKTCGDAIVNREPKMSELVDLYAMVSRMRVLLMPRSVDSADIVMRTVIKTYFEPSQTISDLRDVVKSGKGIDALKDFSEAAREELRAFALK
jgi:hypothetical protein